ncbi:MAG: septation protein SpoVG family protein [Candidatus Omnitrophica bacterium]|nr:septation protein SpoVG family protein [Candidatus Omnitrophota bacterium]
MEVTDVRVALRAPVARTGAGERRPGEQRLKAYATVTFDHCFVVRNIKVIEGRHGPFVAMPSHKTKVACGRCQFKNDVGSRFCVQCGSRLPPAAVAPEAEAGEASAHRDIAHPITAEFRQYLQAKILDVYEAERTKTTMGVSSSLSAAHEAI